MKYVLGRIVMPERYCTPKFYAEHKGIQYMWVYNAPPNMEFSIYCEVPDEYLFAVKAYTCMLITSQLVTRYSIPSDWVELTSNFAEELQILSYAEWATKRYEYEAVLALKIK